MPDVEKAVRRSKESTHQSIQTQEERNDAVVHHHDAEAARTIAAMSQEEFDAAEKALLWKVDVRLVPWMTLLFTMSFLDRINIGTARLAGLEADLGLSSLQFNICSMCFFVTYVAFEIPSNLILKRMRPSLWIPFIMVCWGVVQVGMGFVTNYAGLIALRLLLGLLECGLFPGISFMISSWYKRKESSKRISLFFVGAVLAGAFGGILGYGLSRMDGIGGLSGWQWIFIIEGLLTVVIGCISPWMVHDFPDQARFLTAVEKEMVLGRLVSDSGLASEGKFEKSVVLGALREWKTWVLALMYIGVAEPIYSQSLFTPTIIQALGRFTTPQSLLLSTPPYVVAFFTTMGTAIYSDKVGRRGPFLMFWVSMAIIGYILFLTVPITSPGGLYFAVFLTVASIGPCIATTIVWAGNTFASHYRKATSMGVVFSLGNSGGIIASQVYRTQDKPRYLVGHGVTLAFTCLTLICSIFLYTMLKRENKRRDEKYGPAPLPSEGHDTSSPEYLRRWGFEGMSHDEIVNLGDNHPSWRFIL